MLMLISGQNVTSTQAAKDQVLAQLLELSKVDMAMRVPEDTVHISLLG